MQTMPEPIDEVLDRFAAARALPGCGSAAGLTGALGAALLQKVLGLVAPRVGEPARRALAEAAQARAALLEAAEADECAYQKVLAARRLPRGDARERAERRRRIDQALIEASGPPLAMARAALSVLELAERAAGLARPRIQADVQVAARLARAALDSSRLVVEANLARLGQPDRGRDLRARLERIHGRAREVSP